MVFSTMLTDAFLLTARTEYRQIQDWRRAAQPQASEGCYKGEGDRHLLRQDFLFADDYMPLAVAQSRWRSMKWTA